MLEILMRRARLLAPVFLMAGCAAMTTEAAKMAINPSTLQKPSIFSYVGRSTKLAFLSPAALLAGSTRINAYIIEEQCRFHTPDPLFLVPNNMPWAFPGRVAPERHLQALEYRNWLLFGYTGEQLNSWPVRLAALSDLPQAYLDERIELPAKAKLPEPERKALVRSYLGNSQKIDEAVRRLETSYNPSVQCAGSSLARRDY